jgi:hypothetical protein
MGIGRYTVEENIAKDKFAKVEQVSRNLLYESSAFLAFSYPYTTPRSVLPEKSDRYHIVNHEPTRTEEF